MSEPIVPRATNESIVDGSYLEERDTNYRRRKKEVRQMQGEFKISIAKEVSDFFDGAPDDDEDGRSILLANIREYYYYANEPGFNKDPERIGACVAQLSLYVAELALQCRDRLSAKPPAAEP